MKIFSTNLSSWHTVSHFNSQLVTTWVKSKVLFHDRSEITWPTADSSVAWFPLFDKERLAWRRNSPWLANFSSITTSICLFSEINLFLHFFTSVCPKTLQNFCYCNAVEISLPSKVFHEGNSEERSFINFVMWRLACIV